MRAPLFTAMILLATSSILAAEPVTLRYQRVQVTDEYGKPLKDVRIRPYSINRRFFWPEQKAGPAPTLQTDAEGFADIPYLSDLGLRNDVEARTVDVIVSHPDFVVAEADINVLTPREPYPIELDRGISLDITAVDADGDPVDQPFGIVASGTEVIEWINPEPNTLRSGQLKPRYSQILPVMPREDGPDLFGDVFVIDATEADREEGFRFDGVELLSGMAVHGRLDDRVPRPVRNGIVIAHQLPLPAGAVYGSDLSSVTWTDWTEVQPDGTFTFASLPRTGELQLIALCDGWVSERGEGRRSISTYGALFEAAEDRIDVTIPMDPTVDLTIRVTDGEGNPIPEANLYTSPNQVLYKGGSMMLGKRYRSRDLVLQILNGEYPAYEFVGEELYAAKTDARGEATIRNVPTPSKADAGIEYTVAADGYRIVEAATPPLEPRQARVEVTVVLEPLGAR